MELVLKESVEARKYAISLKSVEYGGELLGGMMTHSDDMEKLYAAFRQLVKDPDTKDGKFDRMVALAEKKQAWFTTNKAGSICGNVHVI